MTFKTNFQLNEHLIKCSNKDNSLQIEINRLKTVIENKDLTIENIKCSIEKQIIIKDNEIKSKKKEIIEKN